MDWTRPVRRRTLIKAAGAGAAAYLLAGCAPSRPAPGAPPGLAPGPAVGTVASGADGGQRRTVRLPAVQGQGLFEAPNVFGARTGPGMQQGNYLFDSLLWRDSTVDPIPWLAEKWSSSPDGTEWTFALRQGVTFHDGQPLASADVEFTYRYLVDYPNNVTVSISDAVKEAKALDPFTFRIVLKEPSAAFLYNVATSVPILPKHIWSSVTDPKKNMDPKAFIGSGPYRLAGMKEADSSFLFVANDSFFLGKPYVQRLEYTAVGDDLLALKAGQLDAVSPTAATALSNEALAPFRTDPKFAILEAPGEGTTALHFNLAKGTPYNDVNFRRAVFFAIDRQEVVSRFIGGNGEVGSPGFLPTASPYFTNDVEQYPYDPQKARAILDQAGYREQDGQRRLPDGTPLVLPLLFGSQLAKLGEMLRSQLSQVGIKADLRSADPGTASQLQGAGNFEVAIVTYGGLGSDPDFMRKIFGSPDSAQLWYKAWGYHSPGFDRLAKEQLHAIDRERRQNLVHQMQRVVSQDVPMMPLYYPNRYVIYLPSVFDAWYFTPLWTPLAMNKHFFVTGQKTGLTIRQG